METFSLDHTADDAAVRFHLAGEVDLEAAADLSVAAAEFSSASQPSAVVDLRDVTFMDSNGLNFMVRLHQAAHARGGAVHALTASEGQPHAALALSGLVPAVIAEDAAVLDLR